LDYVVEDGKVFTININIVDVVVIVVVVVVVVVVLFFVAAICNCRSC
jgi:hypothetical protein